MMQFYFSFQILSDFWISSAETNLSDFWISSAETKKRPITKNSVPIYSELINQTNFPYLTTNGQNKYYSLIPSEL
jgi:hypothetical protein